MAQEEKTNGQAELRVVHEGRPQVALADRPDDELMTLCRAGHEAAVDVLVDRHEERVIGFACKYLGDRALAEEACQETFVRLWQLRGSYEPRGRFGGFLGRVCLNACRELSRSRVRKTRALSRMAVSQEVVEESCLESLLEQEQERWVEAAVARLPPKLKEAVLLRFYSGLSYSDMEEVLGRSEGTLRSRVHHGLKRLRKTLQEARP